MIKYNFGLKMLLQGLFEPVYGDLVYKFRKTVGKTDFSVQFKKITIRYKNIIQNMDILGKLHAWLSPNYG